MLQIQIENTYTTETYIRTYEMKRGQQQHNKKKINHETQCRLAIDALYSYTAA